MESWSWMSSRWLWAIRNHYIGIGLGNLESIRKSVTEDSRHPSKNRKLLQREYIFSVLSLSHPPKMLLYERYTQIPGAISPRRLNFVWWRLQRSSERTLSLVTHQAPRILKGLLDFGKLCAPLHYATTNKTWKWLWTMNGKGFRRKRPCPPVKYLSRKGRAFRYQTISKQVGTNYVIMNLVTCTLHRMLLRWSNYGG